MWRSLIGFGYLGWLSTIARRQIFFTPVNNSVKDRIFGSSAAVDEIIHRWKSVVSRR